MYILKNAWTSIVRNKGRNILIAIIILVIAAACSITLSIRSAADKIVTSYEEAYNVEATIGMNRETLMSSFKEDDSSQEEMIESFNNIEAVTVEEIEEYGDSEYVSSYYYVYSTSMDAEDIDEATDSLVKETTTTETETETFSGNGGPGGGNGGSRKTTTTTTTEEIRNDRAANGAFTIMGYSSYESMSEFINGSYTITEGEVSSDFTSNSCVISEELATLNDLSVGDTITLVNPDDDDLTYELTITGIYTENTSDSDNMTNMFSSSANTIITTSTVVEKIMEDDEDLSVTVTPTYILTSSDVADAFAEEVVEKGLSEYYTVSNNIDEISEATESITNVKTFATTFLIITLIIGGVVLLVINMINIRERKYEIGVLRTIGMKKSLVVTQFMAELLIVATCGLLIGAGIGSLTSVDIANSLLENEISNATSQVEEMNNNFGGSGMKESMNNENSQSKVNGVVSIEQVDSINAVVDFKVLLQLLGIGLLLTMISGISACVAIARFQPLTILKERS